MFGALGSGFGVLVFGALGLGFGVLGLGFWVSVFWGLGFGFFGVLGFWGLGFGVWGLGLGVWGLGFWPTTITRVTLTHDDVVLGLNVRPYLARRKRKQINDQCRDTRNDQPLL